jgi:hypothetical protein
VVTALIKWQVTITIFGHLLGDRSGTPLNARTPLQVKSIPPIVDPQVRPNTKQTTDHKHGSGQKRYNHHLIWGDIKHPFESNEKQGTIIATSLYT